MSFRGRLFLFFALATTFMLVVSILAVNNRILHFSYQKTLEELSESPSIFNQFQISRMKSLISETANISNDPRLRGTLSTGDRSTIIQAAEATHHYYQADIFWILDREGVVLYRVEDPSTYMDTLSNLPVVRDAQNGFDSGELWYWKDQLYLVAAAPVGSGDRSLGIILMGWNFDHWVTNDFAQLTGMELSFMADEQVIHSSILKTNNSLLSAIICTEEKRHAISNETLPRIPDVNPSEKTAAPIMEFSLGREKYAGALFELTDIQNNSLAIGLIARSLIHEQQLLARVRGVLLLIGSITIMLAFLASFFLSRRLTTPIQELVQSATRLARDDLDTPVSVKADDEIGVLSRALDEMRVSLKEARELLIKNERLSIVGRMASSITHDFRQPISVIFGSIEILAIHELSSENRNRLIDRIKEQINRMQGMINELLDFARGESKLHFEHVELGDFLDRIISNFERESETQNIKIKKNMEWDGRLKLDVSRMERGLENILRNAMQALGKDGEITVSSSIAEDYVKIAIHDNGPGIPVEIQENLFDPFVTHGKKGGTGLGLAVVKKVLEEHNGSIELETSPDSGTTFIFNLPLERVESLVDV